MNLIAIEKTAKAKRTAEAILGHLEEWMENLSKSQQRGMAFKDYGRVQWNDVEPEESNRLVEEFMKIIERIL